MLNVILCNSGQCAGGLGGEDWLGCYRRNATMFFADTGSDLPTESCTRLENAASANDFHSKTRSLSRSHTDSAIEADALPIEIGIARKLKRKACKLLRLAEPLGKRHRSSQTFKYLGLCAEH